MNIQKYRVALELFEAFDCREELRVSQVAVLVLSIADNDSEDEDAAIKVRRRMTGTAEAAGQAEDYPEETGNGADDEEGPGKVDNNTCEHVGGVGLISEEEGRQADSGSMSSRSESKPYSSVTHKCEVRGFFFLFFWVCWSFCTDSQTPHSAFAAASQQDSTLCPVCVFLFVITFYPLLFHSLFRVLSTLCSFLLG